MISDTRAFWGNISEIELSDIPDINTNSGSERGKYVELWRQIILRMEQTPASRALAITFSTHQDAVRAAHALRRLAITWYGRNYFNIRTRQGSNCVFVSRGTRWQKHIVPKRAKRR